jgi:hypothetical protein
MGYCPLVMVVSSRTDAMVTINSAYAYVDMAAPTICPLCAAIYAWCYALDFEIFRVLEGVLISVLTDFHLVRSCAAQISTTRLPSTARLPCAYRFVTSRPFVSGALFGGVTSARQRGHARVTFAVVVSAQTTAHGLARTLREAP